MPRTITNIYRQGLPSKIYFLAYSEPKSIYKISQEIYNISKGFGRPQKLYKYRDLLIKDGGLFKLPSAKDRWQSTPKPVIKEIIKITKNKNIQLEYFDKTLLTKIISSSFFRTYLKAYPHNISGEFDGMEMILQIFDLWLIQKFNWMKENERRYRKATKFPPFPQSLDEAKLFVKTFQKMQNKKKNKILNETKKDIIRYKDTQEMLKPFGLSFDEVVEDVFNKPKIWGYDSFLYPDLIIKLLFNNDRKWSSLSSMGRVYNDIIFQSHTAKDIGAFLLPKVSDIIKNKKK